MKKILAKVLAFLLSVNVIGYGALASTTDCNESKILKYNNAVVVVDDRGANLGGQIVKSGDIVFTKSLDSLTNFGKNPVPESICAVYLKNEKDKKTLFGLLPTASLAEFGTGEVPEKFRDKVATMLASLPEKSWPKEGWRKMENLRNFRLIIKQTNGSQPNFEIAIDTGIRGTDEVFTKLVLNKNVAKFIAKSEDECSYNLYLLNNGMYLSSVKGAQCYGNHGDSDPSGFYSFHK